jgi:Domain of unknown function (DUF4331)
MNRKRIVAIFAVLGLLAMSLAMLPGAGRASSHREAPLISQDPAADSTDLYAFVSPDRPDTVTMIANYIPLEEPNGGPYFGNFDPNVLYEIKVDHDGDGEEDISFQFRFRTAILNKNTFLYNTGPVTSLNDATLNFRQYYSVTEIHHGVSTLLADNVPVAPANVGPRSMPDYGKLAAEAVRPIAGERAILVFAGPRDDPFFVDLGSIFDLGALRPLNSLHLLPMDGAKGVDGVSGYNVDTIAIQVPIDQLVEDHKPTHAANDPAAVIGVYTSASRATTQVLRGGKAKTNWVQVSRLGEPLINEVIIPVGQKDYWNATDPADDQQFVKYYENPELAGLINLLYPPLKNNIPATGRGDLSLILLKGVPGVTAMAKTTPADLLRVNTAIKPGNVDVGFGNRLGVPAGDLAGYPNGRRLEDDIVDVDLRAVACGYGDVLAGLFKLCNLSPNNTIGDGVDKNDVPFAIHFPYVAPPHSGYDSPLHRAP